MYGGGRASVLRVGIAGLGVASTIALPEISSHPQVRITAAADLRKTALDRFGSEFGAETYSSVEAMCQSPNVDAVYVLTPSHLHAEHAIIAAEHRKQVIVDKPLGLTLQECDAVIEAAERNGVRVLVGHSQSLDAPIRKMAEIVRSGELGRLIMVNSWFFSDWLYRPRSQVELDPGKGESLVLRQGAVQVDIVRMLGGGLVRSIRAMTSRLDEARPVEGSYTAYLEFEDGTPATLIYSGYAHFDSSELTYGYGLDGFPVHSQAHLMSRQLIASFAAPEEEWAYKESTRYGGSRAWQGIPESRMAERRHAFFGLTIASCEKGDIRQSPTGLTVYGDDGRKEIPVSAGTGYRKRFTSAELDLMYNSWVNDTPLPSHDARWGKATLEVCLGILESAAKGREVFLSHQSPYHPIRTD